MLGRYDQWIFHRDRRGEWRWTRYAGTRLVGKSTEGYHHRSDCEANATRLGWQLAAWPITVERDVWEFYRDAAGQLRWRRQARNGRIVAASHTGFSELAACQANARRFGWQGASEAPRPTASDDWRTCTRQVVS